MQVDEEGLKDSAHVPPVESALFEAMKQYISQNYRPCTDYINGLKFTTKEIYERLQRMLPGLDCAPDKLAEWLYEKGFKFHDQGGMKFVWLMEKF